MVTIPTLVQDAPIVRMTNSVLVGTMKFTTDQMHREFDVDNPAPTKLGEQLTSFDAAYDVLNRYYSSTRESLLTKVIAGLDTEGDQLYMGVSGMVDASLRMTFDQAKVQAAERLALTLKKYKVDVRENMISEWSKLQQMTEEIAADAQLTQDAGTLGLTPALTRLAEIAAEIRAKISERSAQIVDVQAMKQAREAIYPEYRALILVLNSYAAIDADTTRFAALIKALNDNIDYVKIHAISKGDSSEEDGGEDEGGDTPTPEPEPTPVEPEGDEN